MHKVDPLLTQHLESLVEKDPMVPDAGEICSIDPEQWLPPVTLVRDLERIEAKLHTTVPKYTEGDAVAEIGRLVEQKWTSLVQLGQLLRHRLEEGARYTILRGFPLVEKSSVLRDLLALCLASSIGTATSTDMTTEKVIWEVTPRDLPKWHRPTISEHNEEGQLHTDSQYRNHPERYFALFSIRSATDGGGESVLVDGRDILRCLWRDAVGRRHLQTLCTHSFPFRVPTSFSKSINEGKNEYIFAPIVSKMPLLRFRRDTLQEGLRDNPSCDSYDSQEAVHCLCNIIDSQVEKKRFLLRESEVLLVNNHEMLHGRTSFTDRQRLLLRIRMN